MSTRLLTKEEAYRRLVQLKKMNSVSNDILKLKRILKNMFGKEEK